MQWCVMAWAVLLGGNCRLYQMSCQNQGWKLTPAGESKNWDGWEQDMNMTPFFFSLAQSWLGHVTCLRVVYCFWLVILKKALKKSWNHIVFNHDFDLKTVACSALITNFFLKSLIQSKVCCPQNICNRENWWLTAHQKIQYALQSMKYFTQTSSKLTNESFPQFFFTDKNNCLTLDSRHIHLTAEYPHLSHYNKKIRFRCNSVKRKKNGEVKKNFLCMVAERGTANTPAGCAFLSLPS